jgi:hypothetical protein
MKKVALKRNNSNLILDIPNNQITFLDSRFYRTGEGEYVPSVTTYLEAYPKSPQFFEWLKSVGKEADEIRDDAGRKGSNVHDLTERYDRGEEISLLDENGYIAYKLSEWQMFERYVEFRNNFQTSIIHNELNLVSSSYKLGGTIDRVMQINGQLLLVDIKTANSLHPHYWLQLAAYEKLLKMKLDQAVDGIAILWLNAKTRTNGKGDVVQGKGWQLVTETDTYCIEQYWRRFQACQELWLAENAEFKPKQLKYSLTHKHSIIK